MQRITVIPGDGIGPEVVGAACTIMQAAGAQVDYEYVKAGEGARLETGTALPPPVFESTNSTRLALKGPTFTPFGGTYHVVVSGGDGPARTYPSVAIALRKELKLFAAVRPIKNYPGIASRFQNVDLIIFRENSEDLYLGIERMRDADTAEATKVISRPATARMARFSFDYMRRFKRKRMTVGHKSNVLKMTDGLFLKTAQEVGKAYPDIEQDERVIDALCMELVIRPETFDGLLLANLYGDIVSDLAAGLAGGLGVAPGANIGENCAMFEAVHGTAPTIAGKDIANPMAMILSSVMLLRYIGQSDAGDRIERALCEVLPDKSAVTPDLGGTGGTRAMTAAIVKRLQA